MIAKDFIIAKDFRTYKRFILRQDKILRDHVPTHQIRCSPQGHKRRTVSMGRDETRRDGTSQRQRHPSQPPVPAVITLTDSSLTDDDAHPVDL